jgi:hypothetical protein
VEHLAGTDIFYVLNNKKSYYYMLCVDLPVCLCVCMSIGLSVCLCVCMSVGLSVCLCVCMSVGLSVCLCVDLYLIIIL